MKPETAMKIWPTVVIFIHLLAAYEYLRHGEGRKALYWFFAACITASVTY